MLITGADGFIGSHLIDFFSNKQQEIIALIKPNTNIKNLTHYTKSKTSFHNSEKELLFGLAIKIPSDNKKVNIIECDLQDTELLEKIISHYKPKTILHFGAQSLVLKSWQDPRDTIKTNVIGTINLFEPIKKYSLKTRVIVACSSAEYGSSANLDRPLKESDSLLALHPYGISKIVTELLSRQYYINFGIDSINLRFFNQTGTRKTDDACSDFIRKIAKIELGLIEPVIEVGNLETYRDITGISDTLVAITLAIEKGKSGETYNVCSGRKTQIREVLNIALGFCDKKIKIIESVPKKLRKVDESTIVGDNSKIVNQLGWKISKPLDVVLKEMFEYWIEKYSTIS
jgi:GDP-4-dehydro-6-deoxy-D-mannose reductase